MSIPEPAELPLPGGQPGASVALAPLLCGEALGPPAWFEREPGPLGALRAAGIGVSRDRYVRVPVVAFLLEHPSAGSILIDTGLHRDAIAAPRRQLGPLNGFILTDLKLSQEETAPARLAALGVDAAEVRLIVMTHLHFDHASGLGQFPGATAVVSDAEWKAATGSRAFLAGYHKPHLDPALTYRRLSFTEPGAVPWGSFTRTLDLFGDDSVRLAYTPGHSAGHLSVVVRLSDRYALIAGDAIYTMDTLRRGKRPFRSVDAAAFERSLAELHGFDRDHPDALIVPGHDMAHWESLADRYA
jgi:glyoxylase-like metal-dependent hydrolase (beta-lactamase superfamily II)